MQIHVVRAGESIYSIAQAFNSTPASIISANELSTPNQLVVGQALVIPITGSFYWVGPGDSLYSIGQRYGISADELARINGISISSPLNIGTRLYIPPQPKTSAEANAYIEPSGSTVSPSLRKYATEAAPYLTYLAPFSFQAKRDGSLSEPALGNLPAIAEDHGAVFMMVITNLENLQFSTELGQILLNDETVQNNLFNNIEKMANKYSVSDIHFDFERLRGEDRNAYTAFLRKAKERFSSQGITISIALAPKTSASQQGIYYEAHDYRAQGAVVDFVVIMSYEWGYSGGPAQAVSPIGPVRNVLQYAISEIPSRKVMMGQNLYGYDWTLPFRPGTTAKAVSPQQAIAIARRQNVTIQFDNTAQAPFFRYRDAAGAEHEVWFEDARSIQAKFNLMKELNLRGISYWKLGLSFPQNWLLLQDNFNIIKK